MSEKRKKRKKCFVPKCTEPSDLFHRLPSDIKLRWEWINACKSPNSPPISATICSLHFKEEDYVQDRCDTQNKIEYESVKNRINSINISVKQTSKIIP